MTSYRNENVFGLQRNILREPVNNTITFSVMEKKQIHVFDYVHNYVSLVNYTATVYFSLSSSFLALFWRRESERQSLTAVMILNREHELES